MCCSTSCGRRCAQRYERTPQLLVAEVETLAPRVDGHRPLVILDEVQRVPEILSVVQHLVDRRLARFVLTGSSARKLRRGGGVNLLPGRLLPLLRGDNWICRACS